MAGLLSAMAAPAAADHSVFHHHGLDADGHSSSGMPFEQVDILSGNLLVLTTDLVLPGNAGLDLRILRSYNSQIHPGYGSGDLSLEERHALEWVGG